jgi:predicted acyl esterase
MHCEIRRESLAVATETPLMKIARFASCPSTLVLFLIVAFSPFMRAESYAVKLDRDVPAKMRDGVTLRADIYRPDAAGKFPVLLQRTPYKQNQWLG